MKKIRLTLLLLIISFGLFGCENAPVVVDEIDCNVTPESEACIVDYLDIYYLNDLHGSILENNDEIGLANISNFLITKQAENPRNTIILAGGDMLQGSALSNYYMGLSTITLMNEMHFDSFTLGNHEFDWGLEKVTNYFDGDMTNGEANFPLLGANVFYKGTTTIPEGIEPYTIIERGAYKIGIIGTMGSGLEYSIATSKIADYEFASPVPIVEEYATYLRMEADCDFIILVSHDPGNSLNIQVSGLNGNAKVDAIFNAHSHSESVSDNLGIPVIQSGSNGEYVGYVRLNIDTDTDTISSFTLENLTYYSDSLFQTPNQTVLDLINAYQAETDELFNTPLITTDEYLSQSELSRWISKLMRTVTNSDIAFQNSGGTRTSVKDQSIMTNTLLYQIWPFDNVIITAYLKGSDINNMKDNYLFDTDIVTFDNNTYYKVATNDYIFDGRVMYFDHPTSIENTGLLMRDVALEEFRLQGLLYPYFYLDNEILSPIN